MSLSARKLLSGPVAGRPARPRLAAVLTTRAEFAQIVLSRWAGAPATFFYQPLHDGVVRVILDLVLLLRGYPCGTVLAGRTFQALTDPPIRWFEFHSALRLVEEW